MAPPVERTFHFLKNSRNKSAISLMVSAISSSSKEIVELAVESLASSDKASSQLELINSYDQLPEKCREIVFLNAKRMDRALEDVLRNGSQARKTAAFEIIDKGEAFGLIKYLLKELSLAGKEDSSEQVLSCIRGLTNSLYEKTLEKDSGLPNFKSVVQEFLGAIEHSTHDLKLKEYHKVLVEFILIVGNPGDISIDKIMKGNDTELIEKAEQLILTSQHPGVMSLASKYMSWKIPHEYAVTAFEKRTDPEFVYAILREFPDEITELDRKNYSHLSNVSWLVKKESLIELIPPALQVQMVRFVSVLGVPDNFKTSFFQWVISNCSSEACHEASGVLSLLQSEEVFEMLTGGLESKDEGVQAWAVSQLRGNHIPDAMKLIMERLDSQSKVVQEAARSELGSFNVDYIMQIYEQLKPDVCKNVGSLIKKVDPDYLNKFREYLVSPIISQRLRAIQVVNLLDLHDELVPELLELAEDKDQQIKRTLIDVLKRIPDPKIVKTLNQMVEDENVKVKQAAQIAIKNMSQHDWLKGRL
jgi:HEAT repeats